MSAIELNGVCKTFPGDSTDVVALTDLNLVVAEHEFVAIVGPSGCGKSTALMIMAGLVPASSGIVTIDGRRVTRPVTDVGIVFQRDLLFDWRTVFGNIMLQAEMRGLDRSAAKERARALIALVGLEGFENAYPWQLSGGMRQRVAICRALLHDTRLLLLDEPFGALDALTRDDLNVELQHIWLRDRRTAVFITHDIREAIFLADRVVIMSRRPGRIVADVEISLERPRPLRIHDSSDFVMYHRLIRDHVETRWGDHKVVR